MFPRPMDDFGFNSEYNMILFALSALLDPFEMDYQLFVVQCSEWLASIIQCTEILTYYRCYTVFPSEYMNNLGVTQLVSDTMIAPLSSKDDIPHFDFSMDVSNEFPRQQSLAGLLELYFDYKSDFLMGPTGYMADL